MKKLFVTFAIVLGLGTVSKAQSAVVNANEEAVKNYDGVRGNFLYPLNDREKVNVNYDLTPKHPTSVAHVTIHTPNPMPFSANITDAAGKVVHTWKPESQVYLYKADWNIEKLPAGKYNVNLFMGDNKQSIYTFQFSK